MHEPVKVFLARLSHETNSFAPGSMGMEDFRTRFGPDILDLRGDGSCLGAILDFACENGWEVLPSFDMAAGPGPTVSDEVIQIMLEHLDRDLPPALGQGLNGIFLQLHGAMTSQSCADVEGLLLRRIRTHLAGRKIPVAAMLDMHANVSPAMAENADILVAYRNNPHTDAAETALRTARRLRETMVAGIPMRTILEQAPFLWPPTGTGTENEPMRGLSQIARNAENERVRAVSVCPGFAQSDTPHTGLSFQFVVTPTSPPEEVARIAQELLKHARKHAQAGFPEEWGLQEGIKAARLGGKFPALIVEPADNIGGGASGDATWVLEEFLQQGVTNAGVILADAAAVQALAQTKPGDSKLIRLGGRHPQLSGPSLTLNMEVLRHSDGEFEVEDRQSHLIAARGSRIQMGRCVLARCQGITILLTTLPTAPMDLGQWRCVDIDPASFSFIDIKAAVAHRRAYDRIARSSFTVRTPGPCTSNLASLPYKHLRRPLFPFDPLEIVM